MAAPVGRKAPSHSASGFNAQIPREQQVFQRSHYREFCKDQNRVFQKYVFGMVTVIVLSAVVGSLALHFGTPNQALIVYISTFFFGQLGVIVYSVWEV